MFQYNRNDRTRPPHRTENTEPTVLASLRITYSHKRFSELQYKMQRQTLRDEMGHLSGAILPIGSFSVIKSKTEPFVERVKVQFAFEVGNVSTVSLCDICNALSFG